MKQKLKFGRYCTYNSMWGGKTEQHTTTKTLSSLLGMVWGGFLSQSLDSRTMNSQVFQDILQKVVMAVCDTVEVQLVRQKDNDPKHKSKSTLELIKLKKT